MSSRCVVDWWGWGAEWAIVLSKLNWNPEKVFGHQKLVFIPKKYFFDHQKVLFWGKKLFRDSSLIWKAQ